MVQPSRSFPTPLCCTAGGVPAAQNDIPGSDRWLRVEYHLLTCSSLPILPLTSSGSVRHGHRGVALGAVPPGLVIAFLARLRAAFGWRFVVVLASTYVGVRGILGGLTSAAYLPYMRVKVGVTDAPTYQALRTVVWLPWSLKPLMGMVSDVAPIRGYGKRYYILGSVVLGTTAAAVLATAPVSTLGGGAAAAVLMFVVCAQVVCSTCRGNRMKAGRVGRGITAFGRVVAGGRGGHSPVLDRVMRLVWREEIDECLVWLLLICFVGRAVWSSSLCAFLVDILVQGAYSRLMVENPQTGSDIVSAVWGLIFLGALAGSGLVALIGERHPNLYYWAAIGFALQVGVPVAVGWLPEARTASGLRVDMLRTHQPFFMLAAFTTTAATGLGAVSLWATPLVQASYAVSVGVVLCVAALYLLPSMIGMAGTVAEVGAAFLGIRRRWPKSKRLLRAMLSTRLLDMY